MFKLGHSSSSNINVIRNFYVIFNGFSRLPLLYSTSISTSTSTSTSSSIDEGISNNSCSFSNFLVDSLGFSNHQSTSISAEFIKRRRYRVDSIKLVNFNFVDNARFAVNYFQELGFQKSDIRRIVCYEPRIIAMTRVSLQSKIDLLLELGFSGSNLVQLVVKNPELLYQSLGTAIHAFRAVLGNDIDVGRILGRLNKVCLSNVANYLIPNTQFWQDFSGITSDEIKKYILLEPRCFTSRTDCFRDILISVEHKFGIPRNSAKFFYAIRLLSFCPQNKLEERCEVFKSFGWNQSDVMDLIRQNPSCLTYTEARIRKQLDFLMNGVGYKPEELATHKTSLLMFSLDRRLLPRHRVLEVLKANGLLKRNYCLSSAATLTEASFVRRFVLPFKEVHQLYAQLTSSSVESLDVMQS